ncbi:MAG: ATP synthase F1 subunit delta [Deltaproteobacteria bacterium]|jgi:F-type H+-transporting ATPase subunit delta|nr:ATP synthase F1 subunit delta [Deltaproteobacteria bacterium]
MASDPVVRGYAEALFQVARAEESLDRVEEELTRLKNGLESNAEVKEFLSNLQISPEGKKSALFQIFGEKISTLTLNWINLVIDQGRQRRLPNIIEAFFTLAQESREKITAEVITSVPLSEDLVQRLEKELSRASKKQVFLKQMVDESILGGVIVKIENKIIDGSVKHRLEEMKQEMVKTY